MFCSYFSSCPFISELQSLIATKIGVIFLVGENDIKLAVRAFRFFDMTLKVMDDIGEHSYIHVDL